MASEAQNLHFLIIPLMSQSHIIPQLDFAKLLAQRGAVISIVLTPVNAIKYKPKIEKLNAQNLKIRTIIIDFPSKKVGLQEGCENIDALESMELSLQFFQGCEMLQPPLEKVILGLERKPNCIISSVVLPWTQKLAEKFKIPRYIFQTTSCFTEFSSLKRGIFDSDTANEFQLPKSMTNSSDNSLTIFDKMKLAQGLASGTLVNSYEELESKFVDGLKNDRKNVWCIGPVSLERRVSEKKAHEDEHPCISWLDSKKPKLTIYVCFGSLCHISVEQVKEIGLGLEESGFPFIWVIRKGENSAEIESWLMEENFEERVGGRGIVIRGWAPQVLILSHPSIGGFLTHCGWNSTLEGVCAGVPMITWPMFAEQFFNEKFIVNVLEIGVSVGAIGNEEQLVMRVRVKEAVEKLGEEGDEGDKRRRRRAKELGDMAYKAIDEGGSSYSNVTMLIEDVKQLMRTRQWYRTVVPSCKCVNFL